FLICLGVNCLDPSGDVDRWSRVGSDQDPCGLAGAGLVLWTTRRRRTRRARTCCRRFGDNNRVSIHQVVARPWVDLIVSAAPLDEIVALATVDYVGPATSANQIVTRATEHHRRECALAEIENHCVVACTRIDNDLAHLRSRELRDSNYIQK